MNTNKTLDKNRLRLIALTTTDELVKNFALGALNENEVLARYELSQTCWADNLGDLRSAMQKHNESNEIPDTPTKKQMADFVSAKSKLEKEGKLAATLECGPDDSWLGMVYELNDDYDTLEDQRHFARLVFNGADFLK